ncbi:MAG: flagellar basal-body MS-ring/collar protein FliF [Janthinobacterium lividum]
MGSFIETLKNLGLVKLGIIAAVLMGLAGGLYYTGQRYSEPDMALMYSELDMANASKIVSRIEGLGIPVELRGAGTQIYVPADKVARLRMDMAEAGLPRGGSVGYEIFDKSEALGTTGFVQDINHLRALEGELARSISSLSHVESARVHLVLPRRELFARERQEPSASIILKITGPGRLNQAKVQSIQHLAASAVPDLSPERVSIVDDHGNLLARGNGSNEGNNASNLDEAKVAYENRLSQTILNLVEKYVGFGKVRSEVSAELDFNRLTENTEKYDPDGQVLRSSQTVEEGDSSSDGSGGKESGVQGNIPNAASTAGGKSSAQSKKTEETMNYEISKSVTTHVKETGGIKRLSVAVMVDGTYTKGADGKEVYAPRPAAEMEQLKKLIASAIGFSTERKDQLEVVNMRFAPVDDMEGTSATQDTIMGFNRHDVIRLIETLVYGFLGLLALLLVIRPLIMKILNAVDTQKFNTTTTLNANGATASIGASNVSQGNMIAGPQQNTMALPGSTGGSSVPALGAPLAANEEGKIGGDTAIEQMITMKKIEGQLRASSIQKVGDIIEERPDDAVTIVRNWMYEAKS